MRHHRPAQPVGGLDRDVERGHAVGTRGVPADADFHPDHDVAMVAAAQHRLLGVAHPDVQAFADHHVAREAEDPGERDVQVGEDPRARALHHMPAETQEVAGPGAAGVDEGRGPAAPRQGVGIHPQGGAAPVDMGVQVDQPRHHQAAGRVDQRLRVVDGQPRLDRRHLAAGEADIEEPVDPVSRIQHPTTAHHEIEHEPIAPIFPGFVSVGSCLLYATADENSPQRELPLGPVRR